MTSLTYPLPPSLPRLFQGLALVATLFLGACSSAPQRDSGASPRNTGSGEATVALPTASQQVIDTRTRNALLGLARSQGTLAARAERDQRLADGVDPTTLTLIDSDIAWLEGNMDRADQLLESINSLDPTSRDLILLEKYQRALLRHDYKAAVIHAYGRLQVDQAGHRQALINSLWSALMRLDTNSHNVLWQRSASSDWRGWLALCAAYQQGRTAVANWQQQYKDHTANTMPPSGLTTWLQMHPPNTIGVLLPLSGRLANVGESLLDGMIEGFYATYPESGKRPQLITLDSEQFDTIIDAYQQGLAQGADLLVGPLTKNQVQQLGMMPSRDIPVIALNRPDGLTAEETSDWSALSLAPEDEAIQLAELAFGQGRRRALIIRPDNDWGRRMEATLRHAWRAQGGVVVDSLTLSAEPSLSEQISRLVGGFQSEARVRSVEAAFDAPVEARPRRRQDFDSLFMLLQTPDEARSLRPLLVFHYSGDVAVYAPSSIHSGQQLVQNRDLNDVIFVEVPAVLNASKVDRFTRLKALGHDAMRLSDHWRQAEDEALPLLRGQTGLLTRHPGGNVTRELIPAEFAGDNARPIRLP